jgi:azurin
MRPCPGTGILSSRHFPEEFQNNFLNCNVIGFQGIYRVKVREEGSGLWGETLKPDLISSDDPNFRPTAVDVAPDGSIYILDWHNPIIGHLQHHLRDPSRDHVHGRIYRMTYEGRPLEKPARIAGESIDKLLDLLKEPENNVRTRAKIELGARDTKQVISAVQKWARQFSSSSLPDQHHLLEALWVHQWHNVVNESLLRQMLSSPEPRARAEAVRVLLYWRDRVPETVPLLMASANDVSPRVRLEAVRAASYLKGVEAMDIAYESLKYQSDYYLDYVFKEATRAIQKTVKEVYVPKDPNLLSKIVGKLSDKELLAARDSEVILRERLERKGLDLNTRSAALDKLAVLRKSDRIAEVISSLRRLDANNGAPGSINDMGLLLTLSDKSDLSKKRSDIAALSENATQPAVRRAALAGLVATDGKPEPAWQATESNAGNRAALIDSIIMQGDPAFRATFEPLLVEALSDSKTPADVRAASLRALPWMGDKYASKNFELLANQLREGKDLTTASRAVMQISRDQWNKQQAAPVAEAILAWAKKVPASKRTSQDYVETVQVGMDMASLLPADQSAPIRKGLMDLGVRVFVIKTVREQMRYDTPRIVVEAGKPIEIIFENTDMMPHNIVITQPGAREEVGMEAQTMKAEPDKNGKMFVPAKNKKIMASTKLVEPGQKEIVKLTVPSKPGNYDYVCTYPEHWQKMFGEMIVVRDMEAYLKATATPPPVQKTASAAGHDHSHH